MDKDVLIFLGGVHSLAFAVFHMFFWSLFKWKKDLQNLSWVNAAIVQILNIQLIWVFVVFAVLSMMFATELNSTNLGAVIRAGIAGFWLIRAVQQFVFLRRNSWQIHVLTFLFLLGTMLYTVTLF